MITIFNGRNRSLGGSEETIYAQINVLFRKYIREFRNNNDLNAWAVFTCIALHANEYGWAWPSTALLQHETSLGEEAISRSVSHLRSMRITDHRVLDHYRIKRNGQWGRSYYHIFPDAGGLEARPEPDLILWNPVPPPPEPGVAQTGPISIDKEEESTSPKIGDENLTPDRQRKNRPDPSQFTKHTPIKSGVIPQVEKSADEQPITELESLLVDYIKKVQPNTRTKRLRTGRLLLDKTVMYGGQTYPSPEDLWQQNPRFKAFVKQRMEWYERTNKPVINFINSIRDYGHPTFGWLVWSSTNAPAPVERKHNQYDDTYEQMMKEWKEEGERQSGDHSST